MFSPNLSSLLPFWWSGLAIAQATAETVCGRTATSQPALQFPNWTVRWARHEDIKCHWAPSFFLFQVCCLAVSFSVQFPLTPLPKVRPFSFFHPDFRYGLLSGSTSLVPFSSNLPSARQLGELPEMTIWCGHFQAKGHGICLACRHAPLPHQPGQLSFVEAFLGKEWILKQSLVTIPS